MKKLLITSAIALTSVSGIAAAGIASAATTSGSTGSSSSASASSPESSLVDKIAAKFKLNKADVQKVFDEDRSARQAEREAKFKTTLDQAVKDGKLTQAQADYIVKVQAEIKSLRGDAKPGSESQTTRDAVKTKVDALRDWAKTNNVDLKYIGEMMGGPRGHMGTGPAGGPKAAADDSAASTPAAPATN